MKLARLALTGFKSFPQRTDIRFDEGITGIVGPNGSGKSNIADAVRWVLGEQNARMLRGARMDDVIFSGTQKRKPLPWCEVSLLFDNADGALKTPCSEIMVTRKAWRSGESEYMLNRKNCRLRDIAELFYDTGIGGNGYSIIGQGQIDVFLSGRGEERRDALEEAAGISALRTRKEEASRKLDRAQEQLERAGDLLRELEGMLGPLSKQSEAAREYLRLAGRLTQVDANIFLVRSERIQKRVNALTMSSETLREALKLHADSLAAIADRRREAEVYLALCEQREKDAADARQALEEETRHALVRTSQCEQSVQSAALDAEHAREALVLLRQDIASTMAMLSTSQSERERARAELTEAAAALQILEDTQVKAETFAAQAETTLETHREAYLALLNSRSNAQEKHVRQEEMERQAAARLQSLESSLPTLNEALQKAEAERGQAAARLDEAIAEAQRKRAALEEVIKEADRKKAMREEARAADAALQNSLRERRARLATMMEMSQAHEGYAPAVREALEAGEGNPKVFGALARLIQAPQELETAMMMALGGALQNIVVADEDTAKALIGHLRENRLGRATFLPLSAVQPRLLAGRERDVLRMPGAIGLASELLTFNSALRPAVENLLGRTVIAQTLDSAIAISRAGRQAFQVVTLDGDVMRPGGAMSGGSLNARAGNLLTREREIKEVQAQIRQDSAALLQKREAFTRAQDDAALVAKAIPQARESVNDAEIGVAREEERVSRAGDAQNRAQKNLDEATTAVAQLREMLSLLAQDVREATRERGETERDVQKMRDEEEALRLAYRERRDAATQAAQQTGIQREAVHRLTQRGETTAHDRARMEKDLLAHQEREKKQQALLDAATARKAHALDALRESRLAAEDTEMRLREAQEALRAMEEARREATGMQKTLTDQAEDVRQRLDEDTAKLHRDELNLTRLTEEMRSMAAALWSEHALTQGLAEGLRYPGAFDLAAGERESETLREEIRALGPVNTAAPAEYAAQKAHFDDVTRQRDDAKKAREDLLTLIARLQGQMEKQFVAELALLNAHFGETFKRLFGGGSASLTLADPDRPLDCDIQIKAQPPGKKLQLLSLLSGGERALTAIAILFAMLKRKPTPFCILDEIEAALDDANIQNFADYLAEYKQGTQFIVITHRKGTMERCDMLHGITMKEKGVSEMYTVSLHAYTA